MTTPPNHALRRNVCTRPQPSRWWPCASTCHPRLLRGRFFVSFRNAVVLLCCVQLTLGVARAAEATEQEKFEGTWAFVKSADAGGQEKDKRPATRMVFKGGTITFATEGSTVPVGGTYTVDSSKHPMTMDITLEKGGAKVITRAICELDGDTLKLCHHLGARASKERPKEFVADKQTVLGLLKREKK
jgi:uncharacterized protein (TIGR03067 family)